MKLHYKLQVFVSMTDLEIETRLYELVQNERKITKEILDLINLADARRIYLERGYPSLFDWLTRHYGYSESAAQRRIQAARLLKTVPGAAEKLAKGDVNLSTLAKTQAAISYSEKLTGHKMTLEQKTLVIEKIENKSFLDAEKTLLKIFPEWAQKVEQERRTVLSPERTRLAITLSDETMKDLDIIKDLLSHAIPNANFAEIVEYLAKDYLKRQIPRGSLPSALRKAVMDRDQSQCSYIDHATGKKCGSTYQLQIDHIYPRALGGSDELSNLRCLCRKHNQLAAEQTLGINVANIWRRKLVDNPVES